MVIVRKKFVVEGMHCGSCAVSTGMLLRNLKGVRSARADYDARRVEVEHDDAQIGRAEMNRALEELGCRLKEGA